MARLICWLFGHASDEIAGGQDGFWYKRCRRCHEYHESL